MTMNCAQLNHIRNACAVAVVLGSDTHAHDVEAISRLGGGWSGGVRAWRELLLDYAVLLADSRKRVRRLAPLAILARDSESLLAAVGIACDRMAGRSCLWLVTDTGPAGEAVRQALAQNAEVAGCA